MYFILFKECLDLILFFKYLDLQWPDGSQRYVILNK